MTTTPPQVQVVDTSHIDDMCDLSATVLGVDGFILSGLFVLISTMFLHFGGSRARKTAGVVFMAGGLFSYPSGFTFVSTYFYMNGLGGSTSDITLGILVLVLLSVMLVWYFVSSCILFSITKSWWAFSPTARTLLVIPKCTGGFVYIPQPSGSSQMSPSLLLRDGVIFSPTGSKVCTVPKQNGPDGGSMKAAEIFPPHLFVVSTGHAYTFSFAGGSMLSSHNASKAGTGFGTYVFKQKHDSKKWQPPKQKVKQPADVSLLMPGTV